MAYVFPYVVLTSPTTRFGTDASAWLAWPYYPITNVGSAPLVPTCNLVLIDAPPVALTRSLSMADVSVILASVCISVMHV